MKKLDTLALVLTIVGGLNWGLVGLFRFDLVAAIFGGMEFGETNLASRIIYAAVGLSAVYLSYAARERGPAPIQPGPRSWRPSLGCAPKHVQLVCEKR
jgi:uncharacterized membrane protein YuzA (DUF378 family)